MRKNKTEKTVARNILKLGGKAAGGAMGLAMAVQGLAMAGGDTFLQLQKMTASDTDTDNTISLPSPVVAQTRLSLKKKIPLGLQEQILAFCELARNIVNDQSVARQFAARPSEYLLERGLRDVTLDPSSQEVKSILALGDDEVREAARNGDIKRYVRLMEEKGLFDTRTLADVFNLDKTVVMVVQVLMSVTVTEIDSITHSLATTFLDLSAIVAVSGIEEDNYGLLSGMEGKITTLLWGKDVAREIIAGYIANKAETWADAISGTQAAEKAGISKEALKAALTAKLTKALTE
ncbi:MAG: hypothetical protein CVU79_08055 [Elusimicrobia bacterium HGW-Elusimicrobia-3]|nr:MAG: hypothetical protein CVU79_08055 [Elusimicrobia bacterium HGW-Elusimicrobia-3]